MVRFWFSLSIHIQMEVDLCDLSYGRDFYRDKDLYSTLKDPE